MKEIELLELFSKNLKRMMQEDNITQKYLAYKIGVDQSMISRYLTGQSIPSFLTIVKIAISLKTIVDYKRYHHIYIPSW